jgi:DNA repair protein RadC
MFNGSIDRAHVHPREVLRRGIELNAAAIILAHNHPSGIAEPSIADNQITSRLEQALALIDIKVLDHIIVAGCHCYSYAEHGRMVEQ